MCFLLLFLFGFVSLCSSILVFFLKKKIALSWFLLLTGVEKYNYEMCEKA
jgi:hypothetical protein